MSAIALVRVKRGSTWMSLAPLSLACIGHRNATGWHSAMFDPWITMQSESAMLRGYIVAAPRPRWSTLVGRLGFTWSWKIAAPLGHRLPSLWGLRGSPSMLTIFPSTACTTVAHPTAQYGQTLGTAFACSIRSACAWASVGARLAPTAASPPSAVPVSAAPLDTLRKSRRDTSIDDLPLLPVVTPAGLVRLRCACC